MHTVTWHDKQKDTSVKISPKKAFIVSLILFILLEVGLLGLAYWQYSRFHQKEKILTQAQNKLKQPIKIRALVEENSGYLTKITGVFDNSRNSVLSHQLFGVKTGWRLFTPLMFGSKEEVLVDRGWVPYPNGDERLNPNLTKYNNYQIVELVGVIKSFPKRKGILGGPTYNVNKQVMLFLDSSVFPKTKGVIRAPVYFQSATQTHPHVNVFIAMPKRGGNHTQYMWTWLALSFLLLCSYVTAIKKIR